MYYIIKETIFANVCKGKRFIAVVYDMLATEMYSSSFRPSLSMVKTRNSSFSGAYQPSKHFNVVSTLSFG